MIKTVSQSVWKAAVVIPALFSFACTSQQNSQETSPAARWEKKLVKRPGDSPEDGKIYIVLDGKKHWITHASWIGAHAAEYPETVQLITASDLDSIPSGDPITSDR